MIRFQRSIYQFSKKGGFFGKLKNKLFGEDEEEKQIIPHQIIKQPLNVKQEIEQFVSLQSEISDLERIRMRKLDEKLGTNTHFHEIESYEERLDSDYAMRRQVLQRRELQKEKELVTNHLMFPDPQKKVEPVKIRNMNQFITEAIEKIPYPRHEKVFQDGDFFRYFNGKHYDVDKVAQFDLYESLYTQLVQLQMLKREETIKNRYFELTDCYQNIPIVYEDYVYFSRDSKEGHPCYNVYKRKNQIKELIKDDDELIFSGPILAELIPPEYDDLILDIQEERILDLYKAFHPNSNHDTFGCVIQEYGQSFLIVRSQKIQLVLQNVEKTFAFVNNYLYYIEKSDIDLQKYVLKLNLDNLEDRTVVYNIQPGEKASIRVYDLNKAAIEVKIGNENKFIHLNGKEFVNQEKGYKFQVDQNAANIFVGRSKLKEKLKTLQTIEGHVVYQCKQGYIHAFHTSNSFIAIHERNSANRNPDTLVILKEKKNHELEIQETQFSIEFEPNQIKTSSELLFLLKCPYKPEQILKYNTDIKAISLEFQQQFPKFDHKKLQVDTIKITENYSVCCSFISDVPVSFVFIKLIDQYDHQPMSYEDVILYENGAAICQIIVNPENKEVVLDNLKGVLQELQVLASRVILSTNGPLAGLIGSYTHFFVSQFYSLLCHDGLFDNSNELIELPISAYDIAKVPSLRNVYISYTGNDSLAYQSQKMVALLRENKHNEVDVKQEIGVILQKNDNQLDEVILRLTFILSVI